MNSSELEKLSNEEIRLRLLQYGHQNMPVTQTTRKILLKKLKHFMLHTNANLQKDSSLVTKFSSDEESSIDSNEHSRKSYDRNIKTRGAIHGEINDAFNRPERISIKKKFGGNTYISPVLLGDSEDDLDSSVKKGNYQQFIKPQNAQSHQHSTISSHWNNYLRSEANEQNWNNSHTRRLLQLRKSTINYNNMKNHSKEIQQVDRFNFREKEKSSFIRKLNLSINQLSNYVKERLCIAKQTLVPIFLIGILVIFFAFIILLYLNMSPNIENSLQQSMSYTPCHDSFSQDCINTEESNIEELLKILKLISSELRKRSSTDKCNMKQSEKVMWCMRDVYNYLVNKDESDENENHHSIMNRLQDVQYLIEKNSFLGIKNVDELGNDIELGKNHMATLIADDQCFSLTSFRKPFYCSIYDKIHKYFAIIGSIALIAAIGFGIHKMYLIIMKLQDNQRRKVNQVVDDIIKYVLDNTVDDKSKCIVVQDLKQYMLSNRNIEEWAWIKALTFLEKNDSRIHFGYENGDRGEDVKVIRRIPMENDKSTKNESCQLTQFSNTILASTKSQSSDSNAKKWMGPAFDKTNKIKDPPTNCLKIRQMFDKFETNNPNLLTIIQDTILSKVADRKCKICDIQLDKKTCCVYVKCKTCTDAGIIHEEMNGWWLDQRLIVVKFLREDKFNQRFQNTFYS